MVLLKDLFGDVVRPLAMLIVACIGILFALQMIQGEYWNLFFLSAVAILLGIGCDAVGRYLLPENPKEALFFMELWVLAPATIAAVASGIMVVVTMNLSTTDSMPKDVAAVTKAAATALAAFFSGGFVSWVGQKDDSRIANRIKKHFQSAYLRLEVGQGQEAGKMYLERDSLAERSVHSFEIDDISGWGFRDRWKRVSMLSIELAKSR